jgi:hypothetical protein
MLNATIKVRGISESALEAILALMFEECKDVRVETFPSGDGADYTPRVTAGRVATKPIYRDPLTAIEGQYGRGRIDPR